MKTYFSFEILVQSIKIMPVESYKIYINMDLMFSLVVIMEEIVCNIKGQFHRDAL